MIEAEKPELCGLFLRTGHGSVDGCVKVKGHEQEGDPWHRGATWPHGRALEWIPEQIRTVDVPSSERG